MFAFAAILFAIPQLFGQASTNAPPTLSPAYPEIPPTFGERFGPATHSGQAILISIVVLAGLLFFLIWKKLHPPPPPALPPEILAREALAKLQRQPEDGKVLSEISQILRRYVSMAFQFPSGELTTVEFSVALAGSEAIGAKLAETISSFLRECDTRKFSPAVRSPAFTRPGPPEGGTPNFLPPLQAANRALELITLAENRRATTETTNE